MTTATAYSAPNTLRLAKRFFWKECRRLWGLAISLAVIVVLLMLFMKSFGSVRIDLPGWLAVAAIGAGAMLAVAAAVTIFSVEKEEGTADLLARLPQNAVATTLGKVTAAMVVVVVTTMVLVLAASLISGEAPRDLDRVTLAQQCLLVLAEAFVGGLVASLVCANPLIAAVLGILAASASSQLAIFLTNPSAHCYTVEAFVEAAPARALLVSGAALLAGWLASRWPAPLWPTRGRAAETAKPRAAERAAGPFGGVLGVFGRLVWQTLRQSWLVALGAVLLGIFLTWMGFLLSLAFGSNDESQLNAVGMLGSLFAPALLGAVVFRADQRRGAYRFLAEHAGRPRMVWLARNATWLTLLMVTAAAGSRLVADLNAHDFQENYWYGDSFLSHSIRSQEYYEQSNHLRWLVIISFVAAYSFGQYFSLSIKSDVIAAMLALLAAVLLAAWGLVVWAWRLPTNYFVAPLALFPFVASWLRASDWMFDRRGWWRWVAPLLALVAPIGLIACALPATRLAQVGEPWLNVQVGPKEFDKFPQFVAEARTEVFQGRDIRDSYERLAAEVEESKSGRLSDELFVEIDRLSRLRCRLPVAQENLALFLTQDERDEGRLERLLVARRLGVQDHNGRPLEWGPNWLYLADELLEWATIEGRTSKEILTAIEGLREIEDLMLRPSERLMNHYLQVRSVLNGNEPLSLLRRGMGPEEWLAFTAHESLPFERERSLRALDTMASIRVAYLAGAEQATLNAYRDPVFASRLPDEAPIDPEDDLIVAMSLRDWRYRGMKQELRQLRHARTSYLALLAWGEPQFDGPLRDWQRGVAWRRAERVRLALVAYRIDKGEYPETLAALAPDYLAAGELHDLYSGKPLGWEPKGFDLPLALPHRGVEYEDLLSKGTPVLWSGGLSQEIPTRGAAEWDESRSMLVPRGEVSFGLPRGEAEWDESRSMLAPRGEASFGQQAEASESVTAYVLRGNGFALALPE